MKEGLDYELLDGEQKLVLANKKRERGNFYYQQSDYVFAINSYDLALKIVNSSSKGVYKEIWLTTCFLLHSHICSHENCTAPNYAKVYLV